MQNCAPKDFCQCLPLLESVLAKLNHRWNEHLLTSTEWDFLLKKKIIAKIGLEKVSSLTFLKNRSHSVHSINLKIFGNI